MRRLLIVLALCGPAAHAATQPNKFATAGLNVGMSQPAAKKAGLVDCHVGKQSGERPENVYCSATSSGTLAGLPVSAVKAEFKGPKHSTLTRLEFTVGASPNDALAAFAKAWGPGEKSRHYITWPDGAAELSVYTRFSYSSTTSVTVTFDPERAKQRAKFEEKERIARAKEAEALKAFK